MTASAGRPPRSRASLPPRPATGCAPSICVCVLPPPAQVATIENEFRVFPMELLAGAEGTETEVRQHGARFRLDFAKVRV